MNVKHWNKSQSGHAQQANPANLQAMHDAIASLSKADRGKIARALNLAGNQSMSTMPAFLPPLFFYALTHDMEKIWGYHWTHVDAALALQIIRNTGEKIDNRLNVAREFIKHPELGERKRNIADVLASGFTKAQLEQIGITQEERKTAEKLAPTNAGQTAELEAVKAQLAEMQKLVAQLTGQKADTPPEAPKAENLPAELLRLRSQKVQFANSKKRTTVYVSDADDLEGVVKVGSNQIEVLREAAESEEWLAV